MARKCNACGATKFVGVDHKAEIKVGGRTYRASWPADRCVSCGDVTFDSLFLHAFELGIASRIADAGARTGEEFAFMRKTIGLQATELGDLLDVTRETISRWEHEKQPLDRRSVTILSDLVADHIEGRSRTLDRLRLLQAPAKLAKTIPIEIDAELRRAARR